MNLYICPKYCHIKSSDMNDRCPRCGAWMLEAGIDTESNRERLKKDAADRQIAYKDKFERHNTV